MKSIKRLGPTKKTERGFDLVKFNDYYALPCHLQESSLAIYAKPGTSAVWLGPDKAEIKLLASDAAECGVMTTETTGWIDYPLPKKVQVFSCMHLSRPMVKALIAHLQNWIERDTFKIP